MTAWNVRCVGVDFPSDEADAIGRFLSVRPSTRWVLLGHHAAQFIQQLQAAWNQAVRQEVRQSMVARSIDAEFLRYLAGTHHIAEAFRRTGVKPGDGQGWIVHLDSATKSDEAHAQPTPAGKLASIAEESALIQSLGWAVNSQDITHSIEGMKRLGINTEGWSKGREEEACIAHVLMADDQSSSHR